MKRCTVEARVRRKSVCYWSWPLTEMCKYRVWTSDSLCQGGRKWSCPLTRISAQRASTVLHCNSDWMAKTTEVGIFRFYSALQGGPSVPTWLPPMKKRKIPWLFADQKTIEGAGGKRAMIILRLTHWNVANLRFKFVLISLAENNFYWPFMTVVFNNINYQNLKQT